MDPLIDLVDEIMDYTAHAVGLIPAQNIFNGDLPEVPQPILNGLYLVELVGPPPDMYLATETHLIDFYSRSNDSKVAKSLLRQVYNVLQHGQNFTTTNWYIYFCFASSTVRDEDRDREGGKLFAQTYTIICRNLNNIS